LTKTNKTSAQNKKRSHQKQLLLSISFGFHFSISFVNLFSLKKLNKSAFPKLNCWPKEDHIVRYFTVFNCISQLQNSQYHSATVSLWPLILSDSSWSQHMIFTLRHSDQTVITQSLNVAPSDILHLILGSFLHNS